MHVFGPKWPSVFARYWVKYDLLMGEKSEMIKLDLDPCNWIKTQKVLSAEQTNLQDDFNIA